MQNDLKTKLFSNVLLSTKTEPLLLKGPARAVTLSGALSVLTVMMAAAGLIMFLVSKFKPLF